jgi:SAM-dependent methyltransferase
MHFRWVVGYGAMATVRSFRTPRSIFDAFVSHPVVNRTQSALLGRRRLEDAIASVVATIDTRDTGVVVDIGGGTATARDLWPAGWTYVSVDPDERLLDYEGVEGVTRLVGVADDVPLPDGSADVVVMLCVSHHLDDGTWPGALDEVRRLLTPDGSFLFVDGVMSPRRLVSRLGWRLDVGRFPRSSEALESALGQRFRIVQLKRLTLLHESIIVLAQPDGPGAGEG